MNIGFSTGSVAFGDFRKAVDLLNESPANVIELSALREDELIALVGGLEELNLDKYKFVSFHAPSRREIFQEEFLVLQLKKIADKGLNIIVHPDIISEPKTWNALGSRLCIENMDKRKPIGRSVADLESLFDLFPLAVFCLDLAHAKQVDPTMTEAVKMVRKFGDRIVQLHISDVNSRSKHESLNIEALISFKRVTALVDPNTPIVIESPAHSLDSIKKEIKIASLLFDDPEFQSLIDFLGLAINSDTGRVISLPV